MTNPGSRAVHDHGPPKRSLTDSPIFLAFVIIIAIVVVAGAGFLVMFLRPGEPNRHMASGVQYYSGDIDRSALHDVFDAAGIDVISPSWNSTKIAFQPMCGPEGSSEADRTRAMFKSGFIIFSDYNTTVRVQTKDFVKPDTSQQELEDTVSCALDKVEDLMENELNVSLAFELIDVKKWAMPGFEAIGFVCAVAIAAFVLRSKHHPNH